MSKPLHVAFVWHMHQRNERKQPVSAHRAAFAALLTFRLLDLRNDVPHAASGCSTDSRVAAEMNSAAKATI